MTLERLPETVVTLYAELLDQCVQAESEVSTVERGSFVSKTIRGVTYWYLQQSQGGHKRQTYLGRETPELLERMRSRSETRAMVRRDEQRRRELVRMLIAGGVRRETAPVVQILRTFHDSGIFRLGGVLVGTHAFSCYATMLGIRFDEQSVRTADIDIAHDTVALALGRDEPSIDLPAALKRIEPRFVSVPELDPRDPSTSMKVRGRDLRIDFLTKARGTSTKPVMLRHFGIAAAPLRGIDYLIAGAVQAVVVGDSGILVNVPTPARFALHKLWVSRERSVAEQAKARKDIRQAEQLLAVLAIDRPDDIAEAWRAMERHRGMGRRVMAALSKLSVRDQVMSLL